MCKIYQNIIMGVIRRFNKMIELQLNKIYVDSQHRFYMFKVNNKKQEPKFVQIGVTDFSYLLL